MCNIYTKPHAKKDKSKTKVSHNLSQRTPQFLFLHYEHGCGDFMYGCVPCGWSASRGQSRLLDSLTLEF